MIGLVLKLLASETGRGIVLGLVAALAVGGFYLKGHADGARGERMAWEAKVDKEVNRRTGVLVERLQDVLRQEAATRSEMRELREKADAYLAKLNEPKACGFTAEESRRLRALLPR